MKRYKYVGVFISSEGHRYELSVYTNGFLCAFFLLTAEAINSGRHYQLDSITDENGIMVKVDDIMNCRKLFK